MALPDNTPHNFLRNAEDLAKVVNDEGTTNLAGTQLPSLSAILSAVQSRADGAETQIDEIVDGVEGSASSAIQAIEDKTEEGEQILQALVSEGLLTKQQVESIRDETLDIRDATQDIADEVELVRNRLFVYIDDDEISVEVAVGQEVFVSEDPDSLVLDLWT
jgi:hypothetical protein